MRIDHRPSSNPPDYTFSHRIRVRFSETDAMGIVHHSRYLPYLEETRVSYLRHLGHAYHETRIAGVDFAIIEVWVGYERPLRFDDEVDVHLRLVELTRATFQMAYLLTVDGQIRAKAVTAHGAVTHEGRATRLPAWMPEVFGAISSA